MFFMSMTGILRTSIIYYHLYLPETIEHRSLLFSTVLCLATRAGQSGEYEIRIRGVEDSRGCRFDRFDRFDRLERLERLDR